MVIVNEKGVIRLGKCFGLRKSPPQDATTTSAQCLSSPGASMACYDVSQVSAWKGERQPHSNHVLDVDRAKQDVGEDFDTEPASVQAIENAFELAGRVCWLGQEFANVLETSGCPNGFFETLQDPG